MEEGGEGNVRRVRRYDRWMTHSARRPRIGLSHLAIGVEKRAADVKAWRLLYLYIYSQHIIRHRGDTEDSLGARPAWVGGVCHSHTDSTTLTAA
jgi:hypothetical protein